MKKEIALIMFKGGVETQEFFSYELAKKFDELGYSIFFYNLLTDEESFLSLKEFVQDARKLDKKIFMFSFNFNGLAGEDYIYDEGGIYWDKEDIVCFNMVLDHPFYYHKYIKNLPEKYYQISIDKNHEKYMKRFFPDIKNLGFLPLAGTKLDNGMELLSVKERPMNLVMTGNYTKPESFKKFLAHLDKEYVDFYFEILDKQIKNPDLTLEEIAEPMIRQSVEAGALLSDKEIAACYANMIFIDLWTRFYFRGEAVRLIAEAGLKIDIFGNGWDALECAKSNNIICHGSKNSLQCLEALAQAKMSLNVMPWFKNGSHDRIYNSMLNGSVSITDKSIYLSETLTDKENCLFYDLNELDKLPYIINDLNNHEEDVVKISENAYKYAMKNHTWAQRAIIINNWIQQID